MPATAAGRELAVLAGHLQVPVNRLTTGTVAAYVPAHAPVAPTAAALASRCFDGSALAVRRVVVHREVAEAFEEAFVEATDALVAGAGLDYRAEVGSLSDAEQLQQVGDLVAEAAGMGARVLTGAEPLLACGPLFYAPTVLADVPAEAGARDVPTAGPLVVLDQVASDDEAVAAMNATGPMPLALLCAPGAGAGATSGARPHDVRADVVATGRPGVLPVRPDLGTLVDHVTDVQVVRGAGAPAVLGEIAGALRADVVGRVLRVGRGTRPTS
ncbi:aldehyde dehydrogenase family protein [Cellulomonas citrea]|uniref:aldehyde dehydrogenase family protein n=1 Tax=Cellulomonas citrea TaxID=1909423 RepID=UPI00135A0766|nr:aldehyde dehydrogenase family protein [Cellulomonas citrea]